MIEEIAMRAISLMAALVLLTVFAPARAGGMSNQLLTSSAWCTSTYNKTTGYSHTKRVQFSANGTYGTGSRGEGYSSGSGGSMASQRNSAGGGLWRGDKRAGSPPPSRSPPGARR